MAVAATVATAALGNPAALAQTAAAPPPGSATATPENAVLLAIFLRHDQSRPLDELNAQLARQGFYKVFPPPGVEVVIWYVVMGIGQVVTLRLPASRLREVNRVLEDTAGAPTEPSSIRPMTIGPSGSPSMRRRNEEWPADRWPSFCIAAQQRSR